MNREERSEWVTSKSLAEALANRRDNDVKVLVNGIPVPIGSVSYSRVADQFHIELTAGDDLSTALACDRCLALQADLDESEEMRERTAELLTGVANALKGDPPPLGAHDWSDLPAVARKAAAAAAERSHEQGERQ